ncbi:hypothetical protein AFB00_08630 [Pseudonocardia sp. HH130630-07]|nr:hypothetical protein AFB00_08630 [Pseudonocardia sp. HH130630-07]
MFTDYKRRWQLSKVKPGDGTPLQPYRFWQLFARSVFGLRLPDGHFYEVDVRHTADSTTRRSPASLYRDGVQIARAGLPVTFPVPGGVIEVAKNQYGVKRIHHVRDDGTAQVLSPHPKSQEGRRARFAERFPRASSAVGIASVAVLVAVLVVSALNGAAALTTIDVVAEHVGRFTSPVPLTGWLKVAVPAAGFVAGLERATALRSHWLLRG